MSHGLPLSLRQEAEQGPGDCESQRPRLAGPAAAAHGALQVEASQHARELKREHQLLSENREVRRDDRKEAETTRDKKKKKKG